MSTTGDAPSVAGGASGTETAGAEAPRAEARSRVVPASTVPTDTVVSAYASPRDRLERAVEGVPIILFGVDGETRYSWVANAHSPWSEELLLGRTDEELLGEEAGASITEAKRRVLRTGRAERLEMDVRFERQRHWYEVTLRPDPETGGLVCSALDISEKKRREIMLQALLREVSHRSKNLLSMVLSIAQQTSRKAFDKQTFLNRFTGRIQSIARSQDSITGSDWRGASLDELVSNQVMALLPGRPGVVRREGPDLQLTPNAALHIGLALHELTTNAISHGALASVGGTVVIRVLPPAHLPPSHALGDAGEPRERHVTLEWREHDGDTAAHEGHESFGMITLKRIVPAAVAGEASLEFTEDGLRYRLSVDPSQFDYIAESVGGA